MCAIGLGDVLSTLFAKMGILANDTCRCEKRRVLLNKLFPRILLV